MVEWAETLIDLKRKRKLSDEDKESKYCFPTDAHTLKVSGIIIGVKMAKNCFTNKKKFFADTISIFSFKFWDSNL
jgi:hypothetical protein